MIPQPQQPLPPETNLLNMKKLKCLVERPNRNPVAGGELSSKCSKVPLHSTLFDYLIFQKFHANYMEILLFFTFSTHFDKILSPSMRFFTTQKSK